MFAGIDNRGYYSYVTRAPRSIRHNRGAYEDGRQSSREPNVQSRRPPAGPCRVKTQTDRFRPFFLRYRGLLIIRHCRLQRINRFYFSIRSMRTFG